MCSCLIGGEVAHRPMGVEAGPRELGQTDTAWSALEGPQGCQNTQPLELYKSLWERPFNLSFLAVQDISIGDLVTHSLIKSEF